MSLKKQNRLIKKRDVDEVFNRGKTVRGIFLFLRYVLNLEGNRNRQRFIFVIPAKVYKKAVDRNRLRRVLAEVIKKRLEEGSFSGDFAVYIQKGGMERDIVSDLNSVLAKVFK